MGLVDREVDFTNTIDRYRFDSVGRVVRHERGTNDGTTSPNMRPLSSVVYDATNYGTHATSNLNIPGGDGQVTQVYQHPSGSFDALNDIHSCIRYDEFGNPVNLWSDEGPFLAAAVDNLGRTTDAAAFDGVLAGWNAAAVPVGNGSDTVGYRQRYARNFYDELGRVYRQANFAVDPSTGAESALTSGDTVKTDYFRGANGAMKYIAGASQTMIARDRLCQVKTQATVASTWATGTPDVSEAASGSLASQVVIAQTNNYYDANHHNVIATVSAQRGVAPVNGDGKIESTGPSLRGPLIDIPGTSTTGWFSVTPPSGGVLNMALPSGVAPSWLILNVQTTDYNRWLDVPIRMRNFGDILRYPTRPTAICCGGNCDPGSVFPSGAVVPFVETQLEYDPRQVICKTTTSDWESGDRSIRSTLFNAARQPVRSMAIKQRFNPHTSEPGLPEVPEDQLPISAGGCCDTAQWSELEWDKARLKLERMFPCDRPDPNTSPPTYEFNPLSISSYCAGTTSCPKVVSYGYPDYPTAAGDCYPWASGGEPGTGTYPNDNNRLLWTVKPIGESPDLAWHQGNAAGTDDADWFIYDELGRTIRKYGNQYRKTNFGDGNAAPSPVDQIFWSRGGYPTEIVRPSGDSTKPHEHRVTGYDMLGRPVTVSHLLDGISTPVSGTSGVAWDDETALSYDRFGALSEHKQKFKGMFPSACSSNWITYGLVREGTPQQTVNLGGRPLTPWQGPRIVRQTLPAGKELGMAYFPNPAESTESPMFAGGGVDDMLTPARLDWALGRTTGLFEGNSTDHFDLPVAKYGYLGMAVPMHRFLPGLNLDKWQLFPSQTAPSSGGENHTGFTPQTRHAPDWRHRLRDDMWGRPMDTNPSDIPEQMAFRVEGHEDIKWLGNSITSYLDPATSPNFGTSGLSPVTGFTVHGHDEYYRRDCSGRTIYWLSGQASKWTTSTAATAWTNGVSSPIGTNASAAVAPGGVSESEFRWPTSDTGCGTSGTGGWLIAPHGEFNETHPLSPNGAGGDTEWANHPVLASSEECSPFGINGRFYQTDRKQADASSTSSVNHWPFFNAYDAAGNLRYDGKHYFSYDGSNRLRDVYLRGWDTSGNPVQGYKLAHFDYNGLGQLIKSTYNTDGDNSLDDEDVEWTPRDMLGRPIGIWRQGPLNENTRAGQMERPDGAAQFGLNVTAVSEGLNNGIYDAASAFLNSLNPVAVIEHAQARNRELNSAFDALLRGDTNGFAQKFFAPELRVGQAAVNAGHTIANWDQIPEEQRYGMVAYGAGYAGTTAAGIVVTGAAGTAGLGAAGELATVTGVGAKITGGFTVGINALGSRRGIGRVYYLELENGHIWKIGQSMRGLDTQGRLIRAMEQINMLRRIGRVQGLRYRIVETLPRGCSRAEVLEAELYHFRLYKMSRGNWSGSPSLPPGNLVEK